MNSMTPRRRVAALLVLAAGGDAAWTVGRPHTAAAAHRAASSAACAPAVQGMLGLEFASDRPTETKSLHCPSGFITGIRVRYGRRALRTSRAEHALPCTDASAGWEAHTH